MKKNGGVFFVSWAWSQMVEVPRREATEARARETEKTITSNLVPNTERNKELGENLHGLYS